MKTVFVTGGGGYISTHTCVELLKSGYGVVVVDNERASALSRVEEITYRKLYTVDADVRDERVLERLFRDVGIDTVIHAAGLNSIPASIADPERYMEVNLNGTITLCNMMEKYRVRNIVFTSSAAVYGVDGKQPIRESAETHPNTPYGESKLAAENHLRERCEAQGWNAVALRCFNPAGAHPTGKIGEDPKGGIGSLSNCLARVLAGKRERFEVHGSDYDTHDGTAVRDYVHVVDLARGHMKALDLLEQQSGFTALNMGSGQGHSVLEVLERFEKVSGQKIPYDMEGPREGDLGQYTADISQAQALLDWKPEHDLEQMIRDGWNWHRQKPDGYVK